MKNKDPHVSMLSSKISYCQWCILWTLSSFFILTLMRGLLVAFQFGLIRMRYSPDEERQSPDISKSIQSFIQFPRSLGGMLSFLIPTLTLGLGALLYALWMLFIPLKSGFWLAPIATAALLCFYGLFGSFLPRTFGLNRPIEALQWSGPLVLLLRWVFFPLVNLWTLFGKRILNALKMKSSDEALHLLDIEAQSRAMGRSGQPLSRAMRKIFRNIMDMRQLQVEDILVPRNQIAYMDLNDTVEKNLTLAKEAGHTRFPLCKGGLDHCLGFIHIKDLFRSKQPGGTQTLESFKRKALYLGLEEKLEEALQKMIARRSHMALVHDEFGGTLGAITLERVLEQMVGDIKDEFDEEEATLVRISENTYSVLGLAPLHEVERILGVPLVSEDVTTFGGLITASLGRIPQNNERILLPRLSVNIDKVDATRVLSTTVTVLPEQDLDESD